MTTSIVKNVNNVENGVWLPEELRYYVDNIHYVHKHGMIASALKASKIILSCWYWELTLWPVRLLTGHIYVPRN